MQRDGSAEPDPELGTRHLLLETPAYLQGKPEVSPLQRWGTAPPRPQAPPSQGWDLAGWWLPRRQAAIVPIQHPPPKRWCLEKHWEGFAGPAHGGGGKIPDFHQKNY